MRNWIVGILLVAVVAACSGGGAGGGGNIGGGAAATPTSGTAFGGGTGSTDMPVVTDVPAASFAVIKFSGKGDKVVKFKIPEDVAAIASFTAKGSDNFVVESLASDGSTNDLLVNVIGTYKGTVLFDADAGMHSVAFKIQASSTWTAVIKPVSDARVWNPTTKLTGAGDDVVSVSPAISGLATATFTHSGQDNFVVQSYTSEDSDLLINEIGKYNGQVQIPDGTILLSVEADGSWTAVSD